MSIRPGFNLPFCPLALSRKGHASLTINWTLLSRRDQASAWSSTRLRVRELSLVFVQDIAWKRVVTCLKPFPWLILRTIVPPDHAIPGSFLRSPSTGGPALHRGFLSGAPGIPHVAPFSRAPLNLSSMCGYVCVCVLWSSHYPIGPQPL